MINITSFISFKKLSIKGKLILFTVSSLLVIGIFNLYFYNSAYNSMSDYNDLLQDYIQVNNLSIQLTEERDCITRYIVSKDKAELEKYLVYKKNSDSLAKSILESSNSMDTYILINVICNSLNTYNLQTEEIINKVQNNNMDYLQYQKIRNISMFISDYIKELLNIKLAEGEWHYLQLSKKVELMRMVNLLSLIGVMLFSIACAVLLSRSISIPLKKLTNYAMRVAHGDFEKSLSLESSEDINILAEAFNTMSTSIKNKINIERRLYEEELKSIRVSGQLKEAKLLALQSQINPHFLFNTLNTIMRISMFENAQKTSKLIQSLANIFRYNLGGKNKEVFLREELDVIEQYISIQQSRFGDRVGFSINCRIDIKDVMLPRFIIQPLVENSIVHGIEPKEKGGSVKVKCYRRDKNIIIKVIDNGIGMSKSQLEEIINDSDETPRPKGHTTGIGLNNVKERLVLYYNNLECFKIQSKEGIGTVIKIIV